MQSIPRRAIGLSVALSTLSAGALADCTGYVADLINYAKASREARVQTSFVVKQGNELSASSTPFSLNGQIGPPGVAELDWNGTYLTSATGNSPGKLLYSDRHLGSNGYGNPYSINASEPFDIWVNATGYVWLYNRTWGSWTLFQGECSNNLLYGWGQAIGANNGSDKAMYVFSFKKISYGYL